MVWVYFPRGDDWIRKGVPHVPGKSLGECLREAGLPLLKYRLERNGVRARSYLEARDGDELTYRPVR